MIQTSPKSSLSKKMKVLIAGTFHKTFRSALALLDACTQEFARDLSPPHMKRTPKGDGELHPLDVFVKPCKWSFIVGGNLRCLIT